MPTGESSGPFEKIFAKRTVEHFGLRFKLFYLVLLHYYNCFIRVNVIVKYHKNLTFFIINTISLTLTIIYHHRYILLDAFLILYFFTLSPIYKLSSFSPYFPRNIPKASFTISLVNSYSFIVAIKQITGLLFNSPQATV